MTEWHLYQHNTNEGVRYWVEDAQYPIEDLDADYGYYMGVKIRSPRNIAQEPDVYAWPADRSVPSGFMPYEGFIKFYTRVSND